MSTFVLQAVPCPHCGEVAEREIAESLNGERMPEYVAAIARGAFQRFECGACHQDYVVDAPFVLIDFPQKRWLFQFPRAEEARWRHHEAVADANWHYTMVQNAPPVVEALRSGVVRRTVFGLEGLAEKLAVLESGLDDAAVEALKLAMLRDGGAFAFGARDRLRFAGADEESVRFFGVGVSEEGREAVQVLEVPRARYEGIAEDVAWEGVRGAVGAGASYVDIGRVLLAGGEAPELPEFA